MAVNKMAGSPPLWLISRFCHVVNPSDAEPVPYSYNPVRRDTTGNLRNPCSPRDLSSGRWVYCVEKLMLNYEWPGNVRQLRNAVEKMVLFNHSGEIGYDEAIDALELSHAVSYPGSSQDERSRVLKAAVQDFEKKYILAILQEHDWKMSEAANALGIDRSNLFKKMVKYGLKTA